MTFLLPAGSTPPRYRIGNSLRFRASNGAFLERTGVTPTNARRWTLSFYVKRGLLNDYMGLISGSNGSVSAQNFDLCFSAAASGSAGDFLNFHFNNIGVYAATSAAVFRDPTAHMHVVVVYDSANATAADRLIIYISNVRQTLTGSGVTLNQDCALNTASSTLRIGRRPGAATQYFDGYLSEVHFIDGQALTPSSFGQTDATTGAWVPKRYSGTYGANGFYLPFNDAALATTIGQDRSGNGNNWTSSGISVTAGVTFDQMLDSPTNNFPTVNALDVQNIGTRGIVAGALELDTVATGAGGGRATQALPTTGKWYWEVSFASTGPSGNKGVGLGAGTGNISGGVVPTECITYNANGSTTQAGAYVASGYTTYTVSNVIGVAYDADANTVRFYRDNVAQGGSALSTGSMTAPLFPLSVNVSGFSCIDVYNFGQRAFAYTPPTGFQTLCAANLPTPLIGRGDAAFQATLRTGTGATASVTSLRFQPDLVWVKGRSVAYSHGVYDSVRGASQRIIPNLTNAEDTVSGVTAFNSNGYSLGTDINFNENTATYVDWAWREGAAYGFDIVTYTGTGSARTVSHGLNAVPHFIIVKPRGGTVANGWRVYHRNLTGATHYLQLNSVAAQTTYSDWNSTAPTSSVFSVGNGSPETTNENGTNYVAYIWTSIPGFSLFGSYTGNGSADGPFVWCGFRPRFVLIKPATAAESWYMVDAARNTFNVTDSRVVAESAGTEVATGMPVDFTANGFKLRTTNGNPSGGTVIFAAFAETPFKFATAR